MPKTVTAPDVLPAKAKAIWRSAFLSAYDDTCKSRSDREACAAKIAWSAVKNIYKKGKGDQWVEKTFAELDLDIGNIPLPGSLVESPATAGLVWCGAYATRMKETSDSAKSAKHAWQVLRSFYSQSDKGLWVERDDVDTPTPDTDFLKTPEVEETPEKDVDLVITRAGVPGVAYRDEGGGIVLGNASVEEEQLLLERGHGGELADRPADYPLEQWMLLHPTQKTVEAVIRLRMISRAYLEAAEGIQKQGWTAYVNPNRTSEYVFKGWRFPEGRPQEMVRAILVRKTEDDGTEAGHWRLREIYTSAASPPFGEVRFRGPLLKT
ncbi:MAG: ChaB family protein [Candidatus Hodarchaeales archaeon]|jgi:cation transport regulator